MGDISGEPWLLVGGRRAPSLDLKFTGALDPRINFVRALTATYFDSAGVMQTAPTNTPRFDFDPVTHALRGMLIEETRANLLFNSANFAGGGWSLVAATLTAGQAGAPDGTANLTRVAETTASSAHYVGQALTGLTGGATYTLSVFARAQQDRYMQLSILDGNSNGGQAIFDLQAGVISGALAVVNAGTIGTAAIQAVGGGTYRCAITVTIGAITTGTAYVFLSNVATGTWAPSYVGNAANGLLAWGAQLEAGTFPSSYIPTAGVAITRPRDTGTMPAANMGWFSPPGGTWFAEFINADPAPSSPRVIAYPTGGGLTPLFVNTSRQAGQYDGVAILITANSLTANAISKAATTWAPGVARVCLNGGAIASLATLTAGYSTLVPVGIALMGSGTPSEDMTGWLRAIRYWPRVLTDAEMKAVTT